MFSSAGLQAILEAELREGNSIAETGTWGEIPILILLARPFRSPRPEPDTGLVFREVRDPHYWLAEIHDPQSREMLACRF